MDYILQTERLTLRKLTTEDAPFIIELLNTPGWLKYIGDKKVHTIQEAENYLLTGPIKSYHENGYGLSLVTITDDNTPIGICGIIKRPTLAMPDIGYAFLPECNGKGYAYEIANAIINYAQGEFGLSSICAITLPANNNSTKLLKKLGFINKGAFIMAGGTETLLLYQFDCC